MGKYESGRIRAGKVTVIKRQAGRDVEDNEYVDDGSK